ncbi:MAG TPA: gamma-glutamyl-gamma-aminobutyrate hydrolase family protein, partial [Thermoanaerobaculia bacterium]
RLGAYPCNLTPGSRARQIYGTDSISERHRHRYEVNQKYLDRLVAGGLVVSGLSPDGKFVEIVELPDHPWFLGCQFHPEYKSRPTEPHPLFVSYIAAALAYKQRREKGEGAEAVAVAADAEASKAGATAGAGAAAPSTASEEPAAEPAEEPRRPRPVPVPADR